MDEKHYQFAMALKVVLLQNLSLFDKLIDSEEEEDNSSSKSDTIDGESDTEDGSSEGN